MEDLTLTGMENNFAGEFGKVQDINVKEANLPSDLKAKGIRLIATAANVNDCWLEVREIQINKKEEVSEDTERYTGDVTFSGISTQGNDHTAAKMFDGDLSTEMWIAKGPYSGEGKDTIAADAYIQITFPEAKQIGSIRMTQGKTSSADVFKKVEIQYSTDGQSGWKRQESLRTRKIRQ